MKTTIQDSLLLKLKEKKSSYSKPVTSNDLANSLNLAPSYVREQMGILKKQGLVNVRRGPKGGYYLLENHSRNDTRATDGQDISVKKLIVQVDGVTKEYPFGSFPVVLPEIVKQVAKAKRIISEVIINDVRLISPDIDSIPTENVTLAVFQTQSVMDLLTEILHTGIEYTPRLEMGCIKVSQYIHEGRDGEAYELLQAASDGLGWVLNVSQGLSVNVDENRLPVSLAEKHTELIACLNRLVLAMERKDAIAVADICEYEIAPLIRWYHNLFKELLQFMTR